MQHRGRSLEPQPMSSPRHIMLLERGKRVPSLWGASLEVSGAGTATDGLACSSFPSYVVRIDPEKLGINRD